ncbi:hypothetical protein CKO_04938 [Citrobacter koseri ATCC BAA-895]|uniref:Uncharacterized protein n=1 Tax=Citrobacter koseri (strain ATCC BAA-895 / CDC 4225-83 / SGSC4696) TaxID=290338 RepID=A8AR69_CITK8|nr:hypothetical protein CKO_04938 [Citrobacter koseri ATCC BAA-895]
MFHLRPGTLMMTTLVPVFRAFPSFTFLYGERRADACMPSGHFLFFLLIPDGISR